MKNRFLVLVLGSLLTTTLHSIETPNSIDAKVHGDMEMKIVNEDIGGKSVSKRTAEVNIAFDSKLANQIEVFSLFKLFNGTSDQNDSSSENYDDGLKTKNIYAKVPFMNHKGYVNVGLAPNEVFGDDAFDNGDESWKIEIVASLKPSLYLVAESRVDQEREQDNNCGDSGEESVGVIYKDKKIESGVKYISAYSNKGDSNEVISSGLNGYIKTKVALFDVTAEVLLKDIKDQSSQSGYFVTFSNEFKKVDAAVHYALMTGGLKGGDELKMSAILDGNIDSSSTNDTFVISVPVEYKMSDKFSLNANFVLASIEDIDAMGLDIGTTHKIDDSTEVSLVLATFDSDDNTKDQTNVEIALNLEF
jgi:hypothetical protein